MTAWKGDLEGLCERYPLPLVSPNSIYSQVRWMCEASVWRSSHSRMRLGPVANTHQVFSRVCEAQLSGFFAPGKLRHSCQDFPRLVIKDIRMAVWGLILTVYFSTHPQAILDTPHHSYSNISHLYSNLSHPNIRVPEINRIKENPFSAPANFEEIQFPVLISNLLRQSYNIRQYFFRRRNRHWWIANGKHQTTDRSYVRPENAAQN